MKTISCLMVFILLLMLFTVGVQAERILEVDSLEFNSESAVISVSGKVNKGKYVTVRAKKIPSNISEEEAAEMQVSDLYVFAQTVVDNTGRFNLTSKLSQSAPGGWYQIKVTSESGLDGGTVVCNIYFGDAEEVQGLINSLNNPDLSAVQAGQVLKYYTEDYPVLTLSLNHEENFMRETEKRFLSIRNALLNSRFTSVADIVDAYNKAVAMAHINLAQEQAIGEILNTYNSTQFNLEFYNDYLALGTNKSVVNKLLVSFRNKKSEKTFETAADLNLAFKQSVAISRVNVSTLSEMQSVLQAYNSVFNLNLDSIYSKFDPIEVNKALLGKDFSDVDSIKKEVADRLDVLSKPKTTVGSGGSSSSGKTVMSGSYDIVTDIKATEPKALFSDIEQAAWAKESVEGLANMGIINGYSDNSFRPNSTIKREELIKMIVSAFNLIDDINYEYVLIFNDVIAGQWYTPYIQEAHKRGLTNGKGDNVFGLGEWVTKQDIAVLIYRTLMERGFNLPKVLDNTSLKDINDADDYALEAVGYLNMANIINGDNADNFSPQSFATRAETAKILYSVLKLIK